MRFKAGAGGSNEVDSPSLDRGSAGRVVRFQDGRTRVGRPKVRGAAPASNARGRARPAINGARNAPSCRTSSEPNTSVARPAAVTVVLTAPNRMATPAISPHGVNPVRNRRVPHHRVNSLGSRRRGIAPGNRRRIPMAPTGNRGATARAGRNGLAGQYAVLVGTMRRPTGSTPHGFPISGHRDRGRGPRPATTAGSGSRRARQRRR